MFLVFIVKQKYASASKCLQIRNTHSYDGLENTHIVTNTLLREGYITGCNLLSTAKVALCVHAWCMCICACIHVCIYEFKCLRVFQYILQEWYGILHKNVCETDTTIRDTFLKQ